MGELFAPIHLIFLVPFAAVIIVPFWQIFEKAGKSPYLSILTLIPLVSLILLYFLAFSTWDTAVPSVQQTDI